MAGLDLSQALSWLASVHVSWWHGSCGLNGSCKESGIQAGQHHLATGGLPSTPRGEEPGPNAITASHILWPPSRTGGQGLALHPEASGAETRMPATQIMALFNLVVHWRLHLCWHVAQVSGFPRAKPGPTSSPQPRSESS